MFSVVGRVLVQSHPTNFKKQNKKYNVSQPFKIKKQNTNIVDVRKTHYLHENG